MTYCQERPGRRVHHKELGESFMRKVSPALFFPPRSPLLSQYFAKEQMGWSLRKLPKALEVDVCITSKTLHYKDGEK